MKNFKNMLTIIALLAIITINAKQVGKKTTTTTPITIPTQPVITPSKTIPQPKTQQQSLQPGTYKEFLTELRNMQTKDVFITDKLKLTGKKFTDKIIQLGARIQISNLTTLEKDALSQALLNLHVFGTIIPINDMYDSNKEKEVQEKLNSLFDYLFTQGKELLETQQ